MKFIYKNIFFPVLLGMILSISTQMIDLLWIFQIKFEVCIIIIALYIVISFVIQNMIMVERCGSFKELLLRILLIPASYLMTYHLSVQLGFINRLYGEIWHIDRLWYDSNVNGIFFAAFVLSIITTYILSVFTAVIIYLIHKQGTVRDR